MKIKVAAWSIVCVWIAGFAWFIGPRTFLFIAGGIVAFAALLWAICVLVVLRDSEHDAGVSKT